MTHPAHPAASWAPRPAVVGVGWAAAAVAGATAVLVDDPRGALLLAVAAAVLATLALHGTVVRPRLSADAAGVTVRGLTGARTWRWGEVNVRLATHRRLGRETTSVEVDADGAAEPALVVLGQLDLGVDPREVVNALLRLRT
ncbi:hypothetical protein BJP25_00085 [Actinokineospora bangkokensis]|uniref:Low molecular weight protein antigen 6 PH domain-containing protein n=1 Tax=Actinokineospora bangkokensis TaxID=1193682 RepID=A0A1Q9LU85_9PSEU|nr:hypothetical protein BJP25_00085 [Actinokineospora bangkokensis]